MKCTVTRTLPDIGECEIVFDVYEEISAEDSRMICAVYQLEGTIKAQPKAWLKIVRSELQTLERIAKQAGCAEMRMAGRFTQRMFPDYQPYKPLSGLPGLRKELS